MNIFGGRPGISAGVLAVIAILAAFYFVKAVAVALLASAVLLMLTLAILCFCGYIKPYRLFASAFVILIFCTALLRASTVFERNMPYAESFVGEERYIHATVTERRGAADYYAVFVLCLRSVDGVEYEGKALLNCEYNAEFQVGYEIVLRNASLSSLQSLADEEAMELLSEEIYLSIISDDENDYAIISKENFSFADKCRSLNLLCSAKLINEIKGDAGKLSAAMLLGDKSAVPSRVHRDFSRAGLSHYLAVSGLHVSIITGVVSFLLVKLRIKRTYRNFLLSVFAIGYLCLLGFPISAVRSVVMLLIVFIAYSLGDSSDALSSLGLAAAGICVASPVSVFDKSFVLSFCATLGIVAFMPVFNSLADKIFESKNTEERSEKTSVQRYSVKFLRGTFRFLLGTFLSIAAALSLTLLPVKYFFGEVSILSFRSNFASAIAGMPLLASSFFYLIFGDIPYLGEILKTVIEIAADYMINTAAKLSDVRGALVSIVSEEATVCILSFSIVTYLVLLIKFKYKKPLLLLPAAYPAVLALFVIVSVSCRPTNAELTLLSIGGSESMCLVSDSDSAIIDASGGNLTALRNIFSQAQDSGVTELDTLMLTHYHSKHISSVSRFISEVKVRRLLLPMPQNEDDAWIMAQLADTALSSGLSVEMISDEGFELTDGVLIEYSGIGRIERSESPIYYISFTVGEEKATYISASAWDATGEFREELESALLRSESVLIGEHGPKIKSALDIDLPNVEEISLLGDIGGECLRGLYRLESDSLIEAGVSIKRIGFGE